MTSGPLSDLLRHLRRIAGTTEAAELDDARLLERFIVQHDEAAFEALLHRHGPMVLGVCRRLLRNPQDTEDAFQATFLVLLRKASSLNKRALVAQWLYGVAYRTALKARTQAARRSAHSLPLDDVPEKESASDVEWKDLRPVLDEEVRRLPAKYRMPVVLCYLEGKTFEEAARQLGWPAGTVSGRLARARQLLRTRLTRRGLELTGGLLGPAFIQTGSAVLPGSLRTATVRAAMTLTTMRAGNGYVIPTSVVTLMEGILHAMFLTKMKIVAALLLFVTLAGGGAGVVTYQELAAQSPTQPAADAPKATAPTRGQSDIVQNQAEKPDELPKVALTPEDKLNALLNESKAGAKLKSLLKARLDVARTELEGRWKEFLAGKGLITGFIDSSRHMLDAERDLSPRIEDQIPAWESHRQRMQAFYDINLARFNAGRLSIMDLKTAEYYRLDAEIGVETGKPLR